MASASTTTALRAGLEQAVIDVVKLNKDVDGLSEKDATVIRLGRALFRDHKVSPDLWAKTVTPAADKRHVVFDTPHDVRLRRTDLVREVLDW